MRKHSFWSKYVPKFNLGTRDLRTRNREYGFPITLVRPQKAYLSLSPPPLDDGRTAQVYYSTCR